MARQRFDQTFLLLLVLLLCSCAEPPSEKLEDPKPLDYTVLNEDIGESPGKTQLTINILVSQDVSDEDLRALLSSLYEKASQRTGFRYHPNPTVIGLYAYSSREHAESGMGQWLGMLTKTPGSQQPKVVVHFSVGKESSPAESLHGFSVNERQGIYKRIVSAEDRAQNEAEKRHPGDLNRQFELADELADEHKDKLATELGITREELDEIAREGLLNNWAMPK